MKALLVIDMPKSCVDCKFENGGYCLVNEKELGTQTQSIRDKDCPLKPMEEYDKLMERIHRLEEEYFGESNISG